MKKIADIPQNIDDKVVQINFSEDVVIDIKFDRQQEDILYFKPLNMNKEKVTNLNKWLNKIAVWAIRVFHLFQLDF